MSSLEPDIIRTRQNGAFSHWDVLFNQGNSWSTNFVRWGDNLPEAYGIDSNEMRLVDVTGDGLPEVVRSHNNTWKIWRNTGTGWNRDWEVFAAFSTNDVNLSNNRSAIVDVTGDGLADVVHTWWNGNQQWEVFRNTGNGWNTTAEVWSYNGFWHGLDASDGRLLDANGDGLVDIVHTTYNGNENSSTDTWKVFRNTGNSWSTTSETWINDAPISAHLESTYSTIVDVNGDGLPDIVKSDDLGSGDKWKVLINQGNSWSTTYETWIDPSSNVDIDVHNTNTKLADVNGDGLADIVKGYTTAGQGRVSWKVWKNNGNSPDLLSAIHTSQGGLISFDYTPSTKFDNTGTDSLSDLPFNLWLVSKMTTNNGLTNTHGTNDITTYSYQDGFYKWQDREFRGFSTIDETSPNTAKKKYVFNQDDALKGLLAEVQTRDEQNSPYAETENSWTSSQTNGIYTVNLLNEKQYTYDGTASNPKIEEVGYQYDNFGNVTKKSELGDIGATGDERFSYNEYTYNTTAWILNTLKHTYLNSADDSTKLSETWLYYDDHFSASDEPSKGDLTKTVKWLDTSGSSNPTTVYEYNSFGNQTKVTDPNNVNSEKKYENRRVVYTRDKKS